MLEQSAPPTWRRPETWPAGWWLILLVAAQAVCTIVVDPRGNFPLNDDWAYARSVIWLVHDHTLRLSDWIAMNLLPQTLLGSAAAAVFGDSFTVLRGLTQCVALLTSLAAVSFFTACGLDRPRAFFAALTLVCLPWWQALANSYMTDIYSLLFCLAAGYFLVRQLVTPRRAFLLLGTVFSAIAMLERQTCLVIPVAFAVAWLPFNGIRRGRNWAIALLPLLAALLAAGVYQWYLLAGPGVPVAQSRLFTRLMHRALELLSFRNGAPGHFVRSIAGMFGYLGLFLVVPALLVFPGFNRRLKWITGGLAVLVYAATWYLNWLPPYRINHILGAAGIGPFTLGDGLDMSSPLHAAHTGFWYLVGAAAAVGTALCGVTLWRTPRRFKRQAPKRRPVLVFLAAVIVFYLAPFTVTYYFDRYLLFVFPFALTWMFLVMDPRRPTARVWLVAVALVLGVGVVGALGVHDYFAWQRARWAAIHYAEDTVGATPRTLDGGFEYNGYYNFEKRKQLKQRAGKHFWWVDDDSYLVAFREKSGYRIVKAVPVDGYLPRSPAKILLLERIGAP